MEAKTQNEERFDNMINTLKTRFQENETETLRELSLHLKRKWQELADEKKHADYMKIRLLGKLKVPVNGKPINIVEFFNDNRRDLPMELGDFFEQVIAEATVDGIYSPDTADEFYLYDPQGIFSIEPDLIIDLSTAEGRLEARKRLGTLAYCLSKQTKGERGQLRTDGGNMFGWVKLNNGTLVFICAVGFFLEDEPYWLCESDIHDNESWPYGSWFISRDGDLAK